MKPTVPASLAALLLACTLAGSAHAATTISLSDLGGRPGFHIGGVADDDWFGLPVTGIGDFNGDGLGDFAIYSENASTAPQLWRGTTYVVFGSADGFPSKLDLTALDGSNGFSIASDIGYANEAAIAGAGDFNDDGLADILVGVPTANGSWRGTACVVFGRAESDAVFALSGINGFNGTCFNGEHDYDNTGQVLAGIGDFNQDGVDDIAIGSLIADNPVLDAGALYVVFGHQGTFPQSRDLATLDGSDGFRIDGQVAGYSFPIGIANLGDINGDGHVDLGIGADSAPSGGTSRGTMWVVFGSAGPWPATYSLIVLNGTNGFRIEGAADYEFLGRGFDGLDFNGDGLQDIAVGSFAAQNTGSVAIVYGHSPPFPASLSSASLDGNNGRRIFGVAPGDRFGEQAANAGDVNGDGIDDLMITAPFTEFGGHDSGSAYIAFGGTTKGPASVSASTLIGRYGFRLDGFDADGYCGQRQRLVGDINGDDLSDIVVGCNYSAGGGSHRGGAHILFGNGAPLVSAYGGNVGLLPEDTAVSQAFSVAEIATNRYLDLQPLAGAALTATPSSSGGSWQYRATGADPFSGVPTGLSPVNAILLGPGGEVRFVPAADFFGTGPALALRFWDGTGTYAPGTGVDISSDIGALGGFANDANVVGVTWTVLPVNDPPSFLAADPPATVVDAGNIEIPAWASVTSLGPANESSQTVAEFLVDQVSNPALFAELPSVVVEGSSGRLEFRPADGVDGESTFRVRVRDNGGTANGGVDTSSAATYTIRVRPRLVFTDGFE